MAKRVIKIELPEDFEYTTHVAGADIPVDIDNMANAGLLTLLRYGGRIFNDRSNKVDKEKRPEYAASLVQEFMEGKVKAVRTGGGGMSSEEALTKRISLRYAMAAIKTALANSAAWDGEKAPTNENVKERFSDEQIEKVRQKMLADQGDKIAEEVAEALAKQEAKEDAPKADLADLGLDM